jgi:phage/conjugal plasmid C-4 type zinc finger TraR family protein
MADEVDMANDRAELERARSIEALRARMSVIRESAEECVTCGAIIPPARREAVPGVQECVGCASAREGRRHG